LAGANIETHYGGCCEILRAAGIPISRGSIGFSNLHPLFAGMSLTWKPNEGLVTEAFLHGEMLDTEKFQRSPIAVDLESYTDFPHRRLTSNDALVDFAVLEKFQDEGTTDYLINASAISDTPTTYSNTEGMIASWLTDRQTGFSDLVIAALMHIQKRLAVVCKFTVKEQTAHNVLFAYLGRCAGDRILLSQTKLDDGEKTNAVIWSSDLRGSTPLVESVTKPEFLAILNDYSEVTAGAVIANGGEVLPFIGNVVLAIFPIDVNGMSEHTAAEATAAALQDADERLLRINETRIADRKPAISFGAGMHVGEVLYGNIGAAEWVEFSVTGAAANETVRQNGLASKAFVDLCPDGWASVSQHPLRGVGQKIEILARKADQS
jgi:adenylate cyclase